MSGLVPCKFYARGSCKFGDSCRFYHGTVPGVNSFIPQQQGQIYPASYETQNFGSPSMPAPAAAYPPQSPTDDPVMSILRTVAVDMEEWESSIWPFSTYGPIPGRPSLPGTEDVSDEELHYAYVMNGYQYPPELNLEQRMRQVENFRRNYAQPTAANISMINALLEVPGATTNVSHHVRPTISNNNSFFGSAQVVTSPSMSHQTPSIFGGNPPSQIGGGGTASLSSFNFISPAPSTPTMEVQNVTPKTPGFFTLPNTVPPPQSQPTGSAFSSFNFNQSNTVQPLPQPQQQPSWLSSFGSGNVQSSTGFNDEMTYSREEDLEPMHITLFEANEFDGFPPPLSAPPKRLC